MRTSNFSITFGIIVPRNLKGHTELKRAAASCKALEAGRSIQANAKNSWRLHFVEKAAPAISWRMEGAHMPSVEARNSKLKKHAKSWSGCEAIASRVEAITSMVEAIAIREAIAAKKSKIRTG